MEIEDLNRNLLALTDSERLYRSGAGYDWSMARGTTEVDGKQMTVMDDRIFTLNARQDEPRTRQGPPPPLAGRFALKNTSRFNPVPEHIHSYVEMSYVYAGTCPQMVNGSHVLLKENQVLLLDSLCPHAIAALGENDIMISLVLSKPLLDELLAGSLNNAGTVASFLMNALTEQTDHRRYVRFHTQDNRRLRRYFQELLCEYLDPTPSASAITLHLLQLIFLELTLAYERDYEQRSLEREQARVSVIPIIRYIEQNYLTCTQESVAEHFYISPNYVSTLLKKHTGMTYRQVVQAQKLGRAASLLRTTDLAISEIARSSGYENQSFFYRKFKERYGELPAAYRERAQANRASVPTSGE